MMRKYSTLILIQLNVSVMLNNKKVSIFYLIFDSSFDVRFKFLVHNLQKLLSVLKTVVSLKTIDTSSLGVVAPFKDVTRYHMRCCFSAQHANVSLRLV